MGACSSCLGRPGREGHDETEESRLLYDDGGGLQYGSFGDGVMGGDDTIEAQREMEALQRVVAKTSSNMVDVFESAPMSRNGASISFAFAGQGVRTARYQHLVSKLGTDDEEADVRIDWLIDDEDDGREKRDKDGANVPVKGTVKTFDGDEAGGPLVGTFADAAAAAMQ
ncbi:hypothetical protein L249_3083 [Ophiocordyceps polyrhachis-furcata BCC 54312]|uniref:Uncharacterized protein n=1 Tax=Ophiocordyceps polyrhachis-furcata BCC 54312 TaxID=1330021 RepID=A0A367LNZ7_9HYPO|nr:hypothetical protein L249_3083 [Ophiocordyceps polyrhachis-furcata BCC 54312]